MISRLAFTSVVLALLAVYPAQAALEPPRLAAVRDSSSVRVEKGVELVRSTEYASLRRVLPGQARFNGYGRWKTDWLLPEGDNDRIRQDGRWYSALSRPLTPSADVWLAAAGEHFDDRPYNVKPRAQIPVDVTPGSPEIETAVPRPQEISAVRILRGGAGLSAHPWKPFKADAALGPVQDKRIGRVRSGLGLWTHANLDHWDLADWEQSLSVDYNRETPKNYRNEDLAAQYEVFREFFEGNSNRAQISYGTLWRDIVLDATGRAARRQERHYAVRDILTYSVLSGVRVEMTGEILNKRTEQSQPGLPVSSLEEDQAGFAAALQGRRGRTTGEMQLGVRSVTQTIRGDILQGHKTDMAVAGRTPFVGHSMLGLRLAVSKYALDTRNPANHDDRDELRYTAESSWSTPLLPGLVYELHGLVRLDHLVYIFHQSSANNRWARLFQAGSTIAHRPTESFQQVVRLSVSASYQDYDFDADARISRSTVFRRVVLADSAALRISPRLRLSAMLSWQLEEFGRLFWESFEEERSDETRSLSASAGVVVRLTRTLETGVGGVWDGRKGVRFPSGTATEKTVFQNLRSYGPTFSIERKVGRGMFLLLNGRALRQFQLERNDRWLVTGELAGGVRW